MDMFNMKFDSKGSLKRGEEAPLEAVVSTASRTAFRIGIVGAGLGGLSCAQELLRLGKKENIDLEVKVVSTPFLSVISFIRFESERTETLI